MSRIFSPSDLGAFAESWDLDLGEFLLQSASSGEMRDFADSTGELFTFAFLVCDKLLLSWETLSPEILTDASKLLCTILNFREMEDCSTLALPEEFITLLISKLTSQDKQLSHLCLFTTHRIYLLVPSARILIRHRLGSILSEYARCPSKSSAIAPSLDLLSRIISGAILPAGQVFVDLQRKILLPLHRPNSWQIWDRQEPLLGEYHKSLVSCIFGILKIRPDLLGEVFREIFHFFAPPSQANTAKDLLLYTEIESLLDFPEISRCFDDHLVPIFMTRVVSALKVSTSIVIFFCFSRKMRSLCRQFCNFGKNE